MMNRVSNSKRNNNKFDYLYFNNCSDRQQYISTLLSKNLKCKPNDIKLISINELNGLLIGLNILLKTKKLNELYLYATQSKSPREFKNKLSQILYQAKGQLSIKVASQWLANYFSQQKVLFNNHLRRKMKTQSTAIKSKTIEKNVRINSYNKSDLRVKKSLQKLPVIEKRNMNEVFAKQMEDIQDIFANIKKERQNQGLLSLKTNPQQEVQSSNEQSFIPYNANLYEMNKKISGLRLKAQQKLIKIIKLSQQDNHIKELIMRVIQRQQPNIILKNQKYGRFGAMKAHKRMILQKRKEIAQLSKLNHSQQIKIKQEISDIQYLSLKDKTAN